MSFLSLLVCTYDRSLFSSLHNQTNKKQRLFAAASKKMMGLQATPVAKNLSNRRRPTHAADYCWILRACFNLLVLFEKFEFIRNLLFIINKGFEWLGGGIIGCLCCHRLMGSALYPTCWIVHIVLSWWIHSLHRNGHCSAWYNPAFLSTTWSKWLS